MDPAAKKPRLSCSRVMDPTGKKPLNEDPSSAAGRDWRLTCPPSARVLSRLILLQAIYLSYEDSNATMEYTTAHFVENGIYGIATDEIDYVMMVTQFIQEVPRTPEILQGQGSTDIPDSMKEAPNDDTTPLHRLHLRHQQIAYRCCNLADLFITKIGFELNTQRNRGMSARESCLHYALNTFKRKARSDILDALSHSLIELERREASGQMINSLEEWYASEIQVHIKNFVSATAYELDKMKTDPLPKYMQWLFNTDHGQYSDFLEDAKDHYRPNIPRVAHVDSTLNLQQQPLAGLPSDGNPVISPQPQLQQLQSVVRMDLTSRMEQLNDHYIALCSQKMLYDANDVNTEGLLDGSTSEALQNYMQELQQPPLEVEQQPPAGNLPDGNAIPPPEHQPQ